MKVLLVNPRSMNDYYRDEGPKFLPYGILYLAAYGRQHGHDFAILDRNVDDRSLEQVLAEINPQVVGVSVMTGPCIRDAMAISQLVRRQSPKTKILWGGIHPTLLYEQVLGEGLCDLVVIGEGEKTLVDVLAAMEKGEPTTGIPGTAYREGEAIVRTDDRAYFFNLDELPDPAWDLVPMHRYSILTLSTSRGCPFRCTFCYNQKMNGKRRAEISAERVVRLVRRLFEEYGAGHVDFLEDNFTATWRRVGEFCERMKTASLPVTWACEGRVSGMTRDRLRTMKEGGCQSVRFGVESGSPRILEFLKKDITLAMVDQVLGDCRNVGLGSSIYLINGIPGETREDRDASLELVKRDQPDYVEMTTYRPYPGTELFDYCVKQGLFRLPQTTGEWAVISDQYDPRFDVSGAGWRELYRVQLNVNLGLLRNRFGAYPRVFLRVSLPVWFKLFALKLRISPQKTDRFLRNMQRFGKAAQQVIRTLGRKAKRAEKERSIHSINLETSRVCNMRCIQCATHSDAREIAGAAFSGSETGLLTPEIFEKLVPILNNVRTLNLDNHGEPLLNSDLEQIVRRAREVAPHLKISMTSNFKLMTRERAARVLDAGLDEIQVSINGVKKATYEKIQRGAHFEDLVCRLSDFSDIRRVKARQGFVFAACMTTMQTNLNELTALPGFLSRFGVDEIRVNTLLPFNASVQGESLYDREELRARLDVMLREAALECKKRKMRMTHVRLGESKKSCRYAATNFAVSCDGGVFPCWMLDVPEGYAYYEDGNRYLLPHVSLGNICDQSILTLWDSENWKRIRAAFSSRNIPDYCQGCPVGDGRICG